MVGTSVSVPLVVRIVPTPVRSRRLLFDQWHSVRYAPFYVPRDNLAVTDELLDWSGDHVYAAHGLGPIILDLSTSQRL